MSTVITEGYTIEHKDSRVIVHGQVPVEEFAALSKAWGKRGLDTMAVGVASALGATVAICRREDEEAWRREIEQSAAQRSHGDAEMQWLLGPDCGRSSQTIFSVLASTETLRVSATTKLGTWGGDVPHDPDDFGRCHRLLQQFPGWRDRLSEVSAAFPKYGPMAKDWAQMEALWEAEAPTGRCPKLYDLMQKLEDEGYKVLEAQRK
jgi:hypothetical protein